MIFKEESGRISFHFREVFEKCIEYIGEFLIHFREILNFCRKVVLFLQKFYQFYGSFPGDSLMMREVSHVCIYFLSFTLFFFSEKNFQHILEINRNLFIKSITITGIFEKYSNKNKINFNRKNLRLMNNFRLKKISIV